MSGPTTLFPESKDSNSGNWKLEDVNIVDVGHNTGIAFL